MSTTKTGTAAMDLAALHEYCLNLAKVAYTNPNLDACLMVYAECENPEHNVTWGISFSNQEEKLLTFKAVAIAMQKREAKRYAIMSLAWRAEPSEQYSPSDNPDKKEVLAVSTVSREDQIATFTEVLREGDVITGYGERFNTKIQGAIGELLISERVPDLVLEAAEQVLEKNIINGKPMHATHGPKLH